MKTVNVNTHFSDLDEGFYEGPSSQDSQRSEDSQSSVASDDTVVDDVDRHYIVWDATRADFEAWASDRMRRRCRWRCCRCRYVNRMPRSRFTMSHCRNPVPPHVSVGGGEGGGEASCPRDEAGETHLGPGECCEILVPRGE
ncbi:hypothetical protein CGRA01v4_06306 [Colletotrichum graminicola]|uniref:Uncharacterized protein n=1 Tax=Colletotrichum graminicola (strain M1.001 / M2 / FGSC 10212) TaxID=645133 RepID=E3Q2K7_COLGM|nr:uncharacterized protein GLRG_00452 [Colletotrichum graminicola M1.001]EFQ25308.1 hypothetical protein GLRG_00452 [Colletotrichum graminicola M1.001]WDK15025.1 hypothetical protein CGRA01v4_06306 [Colletotrichum graminicola]